MVYAICWCSIWLLEAFNCAGNDARCQQNGDRDATCEEWYGEYYCACGFFFAGADCVSWVDDDVQVTDDSESSSSACSLDGCQAGGDAYAYCNNGACSCSPGFSASADRLVGSMRPSMRTVLGPNASTLLSSSFTMAPSLPVSSTS